MIDTKVIFVEGIMGSGKSTIAKFLSDQISQEGLKARFVPESELPHPTRVMWDLANPHKPWMDVTTEDFIARIFQKWEKFIAETESVEHITIFDGQFFHGDMTSLLLMDADRPDIIQYVKRFALMGSRIDPVLVYFYQEDFADCLKRLFADRGKKWLDYQIDWKVKSPYCRNRNLSGEEGLLELYKAYRSITDELFSDVQWKKLSVENSDQNWSEYRKRILDFLDLPPPKDEKTKIQN